MICFGWNRKGAVPGGILGNSSFLCLGGHRAPRAAFVSIHAPAEGATGWPRGVMMLFWCFNPRTREGCDQSKYSLYDQLVLFQSTHPRGMRRGRKAQYVKVVTFQSTHPRGMRRKPLRNRPILCFNPRTREGCDCIPRKPCLAGLHNLKTANLLLNLSKLYHQPLLSHNPITSTSRLSSLPQEALLCTYSYSMQNQAAIIPGFAETVPNLPALQLYSIYTI